MRAQKKEFISLLESNRSTLLELVLVAVLISLAINLMAAGLSSHMSRSADVITSMVLLGLAFTYLWLTRFGNLAGVFEYDGFLLFDPMTKRLMSVDSYEVASDATRLVEAAISEDEGLKILWERNPLARAHTRFPKAEEGEQGAAGPKSLPKIRIERVGPESDSYILRAGLPTETGKKLIQELLEYMALEWLSTHVSDFFNQDSFEQSKLKVLAREDIPDMLLRNRFLNLFSRPTNVRAAFLRQEPAGELPDARKESLDPVMELVMSSGEAGALYQKFDLVLPRGSKLEKLASGGFKIRGPLVNISVEPRFEGYNTLVPAAFLSRYVGIRENVEHVSVFDVGFSMKYQVSWRGLFLRKVLDYHRWAESFADQLEDNVSSDAFFQRIGWRTVETWLIASNSKVAK